MSPTEPFPTYIYKILSEQPPIPLPHGLPPTPLDAKDGFIHLSRASQIPTTANLFFIQSEEIWLLKIASKAMEEDGGKLLWEGPAGCVHVYSHPDSPAKLARLGEGVVVAVNSYKRLPSEDWVTVFGRGDAWLRDDIESLP